MHVEPEAMWWGQVQIQTISEDYSEEKNQKKITEKKDWS